MTPAEARLLWERQYDRKNWEHLAQKCSERAREYAEVAAEQRATAAKYQARVDAIAPLTDAQMGALCAYSEGRGEEPTL